MVNAYEHEGGSEEAPILMSIFFASNIANKHDDHGKTKQKNDYWHVIRLQYDFSQLLLIKDRSMFANQAIKQFEQAFAKNDLTHLFEIPRNWMINSQGQIENYLDKMSIATNKRYNHFGFLNHYRKNYLAFSQENENSEVILFDSHKYSLSSIKARHSRNPQTKDNLFLQLDTGSELWTYVFCDNVEMGKDNYVTKGNKGKSPVKQEKRPVIHNKHAIRITNKLKEAWQDTVYFNHENILQGVTIS